MDAFLVATYTSSSIMQFSNLCTQILSLSISITVGFYTLLADSSDPELAGIIL